jgi:hypothetical protein
LIFYLFQSRIKAFSTLRKMMNLYKKVIAVIETGKRNDIIKKLSLKFDFSICEGILLSGSMVYGKNYSVRKDSDIDLLLIIKAENIFRIKQYPFFASVHYDNHTLKLFNEKSVNCFWFDVFENGIMINVVVFEYEYFESLCNFKEIMLLRAKLDDTLDIIKSRTLKLSNGQLIQDAPTQQKNGTNYIVNYALYNEDNLISRPIFSNIAVSRVFYAKTETIPRLIECFVGNLRNRLDEKNLVLFFDYALSKARARYKKKFIKEVLKK